MNWREGFEDFYGGLRTLDDALPAEPPEIGFPAPVFFGHPRGICSMRAFGRKRSGGFVKPKALHDPVNKARRRKLSGKL